MAYYYAGPVYVNASNNSQLVQKVLANSLSSPTKRKPSTHRLVKISAQELVGCNLIYLDRN